MSAKSKIEWTDHTFNPWIGCTKVSPGCLHCYAETRDRRHLIEKVDHWGKGAPRLRTSASYWKQPLKWNRILQGLHVAPPMICDCCGNLYAGRDSCLHTTHLHRPRVFCASLADIFDDEVPIEWLADFLALIHKCQNLDFQILTKRPENWRARLCAVFDYFASINSEHEVWIEEWVNEDNGPANVWIGTSVEDQKRADERIPLLLQIPAKIRFLSCEPLLGPVDLHSIPVGGGRYYDLSYSFGPGLFDFQSRRISDARIDWIIAGGESGHGARPMHPDWARSLRDQCQAAGVPFFFKQWGEFVSVSEVAGPGDHFKFPDGATVRRTGKKIAGRTLDGREWSEFPLTSTLGVGRSALGVFPSSP